MESEIMGAFKKIHPSVKIGKNVFIASEYVSIDEGTVIGDNVTIIAYERLEIGKFCIIRPDAFIKVRSLEMGDYFFSDNNPRKLIIGGGGSDRPTARIKIGKQCVIHDSYINVCMPVEIGDNVGLSPSSDIITHGFWNSVLEGYSVKYGEVKIGSGSIIGYRALILPNVTLGKNVSVGAGAVVTKSFPDNVVIGGVPASIITQPPVYPKQLTDDEKISIMKRLLREYAELLDDKVDKVIFTIDKNNGDHIKIVGKYNDEFFDIDFSNMVINIKYGTEFSIFLLSNNYNGVDNAISDDLRDFLRHYGIRIFSRHLKSIPPKIKVKLGIREK
jgi:acetyltransferase-like isoleucine patch superfamily enzyme